MIRLFVADDHEVVREGIRRIVGQHPDMEIVGEATTGVELLEKLPGLVVDVLLMDVTMPGPGFKGTLAGVQELRPELPVLVLSIHPEELWAVQAFRAGAAGYLTKGHSGKELTEAVRRVHEGGRYVTRALGEILAQHVLEDPDSEPHNKLLSPRELQVLRALGQGETPKKIAKSLDLSPKTISTYRSRILEKLDLANNADLIRYVLKHGL